MKHKTLLLSFFVFAALMTTSGARAHEHATAVNSDSTTGRMEERKDLRQDIVAERRETMGMRFDEFKKARISGMIEMMKIRFEWAIERLENIADRIEARIDKIEDETDTTLTDARMHLSEARTDIADATRLLAAITIDVDDIIAEETEIGTRFSRFREDFAAVKAEIKSARMHLREALDAIKGEHQENRLDGKTEPIDDWNTNNSR